MPPNTYIFTMNFLKSSMPGTNSSPVPSAEAPHFKNAQAVEEQGSSPTSPTFDNVPRRSSDDTKSGFKWDMFSTENPEGGQEQPLSQRERRMSKEWDASKVPPSRFQKREGSIHATPASRDGHVDRNKLKSFAEKYGDMTTQKKGERRKSQS